MDLELWKQRTPNVAALAVESHGLTDRGRVRPTNEDQFVIADLARSLRVRESSLPQPSLQFGDVRGHLFLVADGVGGARGGDEASALAVGTIEDFVLNSLRWWFENEGSGEQLRAQLERALHDADQRILHEGLHHPGLRGMGTTVTLAYALGSTLYLAHVGDSRAYLQRDGGLMRLTRDHTLVARLIERGELDPVQAAHHQLRHVITNVVGGDRAGVQPDFGRAHLLPDDVLLLCSDGLTEMVADDEIAAVLAAEPRASSACEQLVERANQRGGRDNVTVVVARFGAAPVWRGRKEPES